MTFRTAACPGSAYTSKQKRQARHIEEGYEDRGVPRKEAARRAWATVNKETGGGKRSGSGRGKPVNRAPSRKGGRKGGRAAALAAQGRTLGIGAQSRGDPEATA